VRAAGLEVTVRGVVDEAADQHLRQLTGRDEHGHLFGRPVAHGPRRVVRVHHRVYRVVHDDEPPGGRRELHVREPRVQQHGDVMIPVQEDERLLAEHDEYRVAELRQLGQHEQPRPEPGHGVILDVAAIGKEQKQKKQMIRLRNKMFMQIV